MSCWKHSDEDGFGCGITHGFQVESCQVRRTGVVWLAIRRAGPLNVQAAAFGVLSRGRWRHTHRCQAQACKAVGSRGLLPSSGIALKSQPQPDRARRTAPPRVNCQDPAGRGEPCAEGACPPTLRGCPHPVRTAAGLLLRTRPMTRQPLFHVHDRGHGLEVGWPAPGRAGALDARRSCLDTAVSPCQAHL